MSQLFVSTSQITFQPNETIKALQLTNKSQTSDQRRPIMYKIKTNKIDYVDAKPSCGYISGKHGHNEISVAIRSLNNKKEYTAKLQVLYIAHQKITEELVQKNKKHFDINEYNQIYDSIKASNRNDAQSVFVGVTKKVEDTSQDAPIQQHIEDSKSKFKVEKLAEQKRAITTRQNQSVDAGKDRLLKVSMIMLVIGMLIGFVLGCNYGHIFVSQDTDVSQIEPQRQTEEHIISQDNTLNQGSQTVETEKTESSVQQKNFEETNHGQENQNKENQEENFIGANEQQVAADQAFNQKPQATNDEEEASKDAVQQQQQEQEKQLPIEQTL